MSNLAQRLIKARTGTVEAGGLIWHIKIPSLSEILSAGAKHIPRLEMPTGDDASSYVPSPQERADLAIGLMADASAHACAWVTGAQESPTGPVEPIELVSEIIDEDPAAGKVWVGTLPPTVVREIVDGAATLCTDGGRLTRAIANFPSRSE
jgi:hypothetical protein